MQPERSSIDDLFATPGIMPALSGKTQRSKSQSPDGRSPYSMSSQVYAPGSPHSPRGQVPGITFQPPSVERPTA